MKGKIESQKVIEYLFIYLFTHNMVVSKTISQNKITQLNFKKEMPKK